MLALARQGDLVAAAGRPPIVVPLSHTNYPASWSTPRTRFEPTPSSPGTITSHVRVEAPGEFDVWLGGSLRPGVELAVDGEPAAEVRHELNNSGEYVELGTVQLSAGTHKLEIRIGGADLHPGSAGNAGPIGPLSLSSTDPADVRLVRVPAARARRLCGRAWDWIEVAR